MVKFVEYFEAIVTTKPEWRNRCIPVAQLHDILIQLRAGDAPDDSCDDFSFETAARSVQHALSESAPLLANGGATPHALSLATLSSPGTPVSPSFAGSGGGGGVEQHLPPQLNATSPVAGQSAAALSAISPSSLELELQPQFEKALLDSATAASIFATESLEKCRHYLRGGHATWRRPGHSAAHGKECLRYLHRELAHLVQFVELNHLAATTLHAKYAALCAHRQRAFATPAWRTGDAPGCVLGLRPLADAASALQSEVIREFAQHFTDGSDIVDAMARIGVTTASPRQGVRTGTFLGLTIAAVLYCLHLKFELEPAALAVAQCNWMFPVGRLCLTLLFAGVCWSWVLWSFESRRINYQYVFEFDPTSSLSWMQCLEFSIGFFFLALLACILFVRSELQFRAGEYSTAGGFPEVTPYILPAFLLVWVLAMVRPPRSVMRRTRDAFVLVLLRCARLPFGEVRFVDFFVADWGTSLVLPCGDLLYTACFFSAGIPDIRDNVPSNRCLDVANRFNFPVAMVPYFWRACQTFKMYLRTRKRIHLINHGKYQTFLLWFALSFVQANSPNATLAVFVWIAHIAAQLYAWVFDVLFDWGFIRGRERKRMYGAWRPYVLAFVVDFVLRMYFVLCIVYFQPVLGQNFMFLVQAMVEVFRRSMWSIFRIENENVNNLELYRRIDFVPRVLPSQ